jgi:hypothetical protein
MNIRQSIVLSVPVVREVHFCGTFKVVKILLKIIVQGVETHG